MANLVRDWLLFPLRCDAGDPCAEKPPERAMAAHSSRRHPSDQAEVRIPLTEDVSFLIVLGNIEAGLFVGHADAQSHHCVEHFQQNEGGDNGKHPGNRRCNQLSRKDRPPLRAGPMASLGRYPIRPGWQTRPSGWPPKCHPTHASRTRRANRRSRAWASGPNRPASRARRLQFP